MKVVFESYSSNQEIPALDYLKKRKLIKFFNRETSAGIVCLAKLLEGAILPGNTPFYYGKAHTAYEDFDVEKLVEASRDETGGFSQEYFVTRGMSGVSPLTQFKLLYNMPLCFISQEHNLTGDNAVIYTSAQGLIMQALHAPGDLPVLLGAGKVHRDGRVESGFTLALKEEIKKTPLRDNLDEAIEIFRYWHEQGQ